MPVSPEERPVVLSPCGLNSSSYQKNGTTGGSRGVTGEDSLLKFPAGGREWLIATNADKRKYASAATDYANAEGAVFFPAFHTSRAAACI